MTAGKAKSVASKSDPKGFRKLLIVVATCALIYGGATGNKGVAESGKTILEAAVKMAQV